MLTVCWFPEEKTDLERQLLKIVKSCCKLSTDHLVYGGTHWHHLYVWLIFHVYVNALTLLHAPVDYLTSVLAGIE